MRKERFSRRGFGKSAIGLAFTTVAEANTGLGRGRARAARESDERGLTPSQSAEVEARYNEVMRRYADRLSEEQRKRVRRVLAQNERMLGAIREFAIENGDAPATTLRICIEESPAPR